MFWTIFGAKNFFPENPAFSCTTSHGFLAPWQNLEKKTPRETKEQKDGWKDRMMVGRNNGQTLFYRNLPATTWGSNSAFNQILQHNFSFEKSWEFSRHIQQQYTPKELHCLLLHSDIDKLYIFYCETFW